MAVYSVGVATTAGSTTLPSAGIYQPASPTARIAIRQIEVFNTTATAVTTYGIRRITAIGTPGAAQTAVLRDTTDVAATAIVATTWTVTPTFVTGSAKKFPIGAAIGAGVIYPVSESNEMIVPATANNGVVIVLDTGTGQVLNVNIVWEEVR